MPESRHKYLYERLGDHDFQLLVNALLADRHSDMVPLPLRQADGGRDGIDFQRALVYQVKWAVNGLKSKPISWLDDVIRREEKNLRRLASKGVKRYLLVTNIASTGAHDTGTFDRARERLDTYEAEFGFENITCIWREGLDAMVDAAPSETKWQYAEMLAGWDLIRYLISADDAQRRDKGLKELLRRVAATQWADDELIKFSQADVDRERVVDLFVDVTANRIYSSTGRSLLVGGTAEYLLAQSGSTTTLIRGAPGQGKSTLSQYVCLAHRAEFIPVDWRPDQLARPAHPRFPLKVELGEYARWLDGDDVFRGEEAESVKRRRRSGLEGSVECFLAEAVTSANGGAPVSVEELHGILSRVPTVLIFDGLDEVGSARSRRRVVSAIDAFGRRARANAATVQIVITTRPSANGLPEPSDPSPEILVLNQLTPSQRDDFLRNWCAVRGIRGREGRALRRDFKAQAAESHIGDLAGNPMQLTILLDLLHERGAATPTQRTELYDSYVDLLLAREANKKPSSVRKHRTQLVEIVPFLGWYMQSRSEEAESGDKMSGPELLAAMRHFQNTYERPLFVIDELFEAASERLWAVTSKANGLYEFEIASLREYFAARFLYKYAGEDVRRFDRAEVFKELLDRPYWSNTARFYAGNAEGGEVVVLADCILEEVATDPSRQLAVTAWNLLTDGVFGNRPRQAREVVEALLGSDRRLRWLLDACESQEVGPLRSLPELPEREGLDPTWVRLTRELLAHPAHSNSTMWVATLRNLVNEPTRFSHWWLENYLSKSASSDGAAWLALAAHCEAAAGIEIEHIDADLRSPGIAQGILNSGLVPGRGSLLEAGLLEAVLDGRCAGTASIRSMPGQAAVALNPANYLALVDQTEHPPEGDDPQRRQRAVNLLRSSHPGLATVASERRFRRGERGSTFPWARSAASLFDSVGRCWLSSEIAVIGAASPYLLGMLRRPGAAPFGPEAHPCELLALTRTFAQEPRWWRDQLGLLRLDPSDDLGAAEWALALWCVASGPVIETLIDEWKTVVSGLPDMRREIVWEAAQRVGLRGWLRGRPVSLETDDLALEALATTRRHARSLQPTSPPPGMDSFGLSPLAAVARERQWFKVDAMPTYR